MKTYNYEQISKLIQPLMDLMKEEYPNNAELVINSEFAKIKYTLTDMSFMRKDVRLPLEGMDKLAEALAKTFGPE